MDALLILLDFDCSLVKPENRICFLLFSFLPFCFLGLVQWSISWRHIIKDLDRMNLSDGSHLFRI